MLSSSFKRSQLTERVAANRILVNQWDQLECSGCHGLGRLYKQERAYRRRGGRGAFSSSSRMLHANFSELDSCASDRGCVACQVFRRAILLEQCTIHAHHDLAGKNAQDAVVVSLRCCADATWLEVCTGIDARPSKAAIALSTSNSRRDYPRVPYEQPLSPHRIARLTSWISTCHQMHLCANYKYSQRNPTWLIRILPERMIQLVRGHGSDENDGDLLKYVALSYCWGDEQSIKATDPKAWDRVTQSYTTDAKSRQIPFPVTDLSDTLQDAIAITHSLGINYIWIDSVCVPRGSWEMEANRMHEVYGNAYFTLSSSGTSKATDRMLTVREAWRHVSRGCRLYEPWLLNMDMSLDEMRLRSPVAARGWILQEERLSPRILYWCAQRAYWSCIECQRIEAKQAGGVWQRGAETSLSHPQKFMQLCRSGDLGALREEWCDIIASYARRSLSDVGLESNRFAAFSGLAVRYLSSSSTLATRDEYLAGLWRKTLAQNLMWQVKEGLCPRGNLQHVIPSWSWLSLPLCTEIGLPSVVEASPYFRLLTESRVAIVDTDLEIVAKGAAVKVLSVAGRLRPWVADAGAAKVPWDGIERQHPLRGFDFSLDPTQSVYARNPAGKILVYEAHQQEVIGQLDYIIPEERSDGRGPEVEEGTERHLHCLEVGNQAMILMERMDMQDNAFRRVGVSFGYRRNFFEGASVATLELV